MAEEIDVSVAPAVDLNVSFSKSLHPQQRPTLLPIHFWGGSSKSWSEFNAALKDEFNIVTPSLRGWGKSSKPAEALAYTTRDYAEDVLALIRHLNIHRPELISSGIVLVGHSLGGKIAQKIITYPEAHSFLKGLVLVGTSPAKGSDFSDAMKDQMTHVFDTVESSEEAFKHFLLGQKAINNPSLVRSLAEVAVTGSREAAWAFPRYGCAEDFEASVTEVVRRRKETGKPLKIAVVEGRERPENAKEKVVDVLTAAGADVLFQVLESGHLMPVEVPEQLASLVSNYVAGL